jgi:hypothetical protein
LLPWKLLTVVVIGKDKTKWGKVTFTHIWCRWQNSLTKLPGVIGRARKATTPFEAWNYLSTDGIFDNITQHRNQYIPIIQPNFSSSNDAKPTDKTETKPFSGPECFPRAHRSTKLSLEELWGTDGDSRENLLSDESEILQDPNQMHLE